MDVWDLVRDLGDGVELDDDAVGAAERTLRQAIDGETARKRRFRWALGGGIGAAVLAGAAATAVALSMAQPTAPVVQPNPDAGGVETPVVTVEPAPDPTPTTPAAPVVPTAQDVLEGAAALAVESAGSVMADGRYLRIEHTTEQLVLYAQDAPESPYNATRESATAAWVSTGTWVQYIPSERSGEWVRVFEPEHEITGRFGAATDQLIAEWDRNSGVDELIVDRVQGGVAESFEGETAPGSDAYYAEMPLDPGALLEWNRQRAVDANLAPDGALDAAVVIMLIQDLELNAAPPALRAAMFRALALVPGAEIVAADQATSTIAYTYPGDRREMLTVDTATGLVTSRSTTFGPTGSVVPASVANFTYRTTVSVVDEAP